MPRRTFIQLRQGELRHAATRFCHPLRLNWYGLKTKKISKIYQVFASVLSLSSEMCKPTVTSEIRVHFHSFQLNTRSFQKCLRKGISYAFSCFQRLRKENFCVSLLNNGFFKCLATFKRLKKKYQKFGSFDHFDHFLMNKKRETSVAPRQV